MRNDEHIEESMFPCGDHGEKLASLGAQVTALKERGDERHCTILRKLDTIIVAGEETNGRLGALENWRSSVGSSLEQTKKMADSIQNIEIVQHERGGERRVWMVIWGLVIVLLGGATSAVAGFAMHKIWP